MGRSDQENAEQHNALLSAPPPVPRPATNEHVDSDDAVRELRRGISALSLEVDGSIVQWMREKAEAVIAKLATERERVAELQSNNEELAGIITDMENNWRPVES